MQKLLIVLAATFKLFSYLFMNSFMQSHSHCDPWIYNHSRHGNCHGCHFSCVLLHVCSHFDGFVCHLHSFVQDYQHSRHCQRVLQASIHNITRHTIT